MVGINVPRGGLQQAELYPQLSKVQHSFLDFNLVFLPMTSCWWLFRSFTPLDEHTSRPKDEEGPATDQK